MALFFTNKQNNLGLGFSSFFAILAACLFPDLGFLLIVLLIFVYMGFCGSFHSFLLHMLPKKRPAENDHHRNENRGGQESKNNRNSSSVAGNSINASNMGFEDGNLQEIDEDLHSRQLDVQSNSYQWVLFLRFTSRKGGGAAEGTASHQWVLILEGISIDPYMLGIRLDLNGIYIIPCRY
ncbi:hypothetical protein LXL04_024017 [Taraxacum kok-saghyz]